jgi:hypothetical protein
MNPINDLTTIQTQQIARFERNVEISATGLNYSVWTFCVFFILLWIVLKTKGTRHTKNDELEQFEEFVVLAGSVISLLVVIVCLIAYSYMAYEYLDGNKLSRDEYKVVNCEVQWH